MTQTQRLPRRGFATDTQAQYVAFVNASFLDRQRHGRRDRRLSRAEPGRHVLEDHADLWPSFTNGFSLYAELTPAQLRLSRQMIAYWGAFTWSGSPRVPGQPYWPAYSGSAGANARLMSLRPGNQSRAITAATFGAEHQCSFWDQHLTS